MMPVVETSNPIRNGMSATTAARIDSKLSWFDRSRVAPKATGMPNAIPTGVRRDYKRQSRWPGHEGDTASPNAWRWTGSRYKVRASLDSPYG